MKKENLIICCCLFAVLFTGCKNHVYVKTPGTLSTLISETEKYELTTLKVVGNLNSDDIRFLREMAGCDARGIETDGKLAILDLSEVTIFEGGNLYYYGGAPTAKHCTSNNSIGSHMFDHCARLISIVLPNNVTSIGEFAFEECTGLTSITIPNSVTSIGQWAFSYCASLSSITIPNSVTSILAGTFYGCTELKEIVIPSRVESIGAFALPEFIGLKEIYSASPVPPSCHYFAFDKDVKSNCTLYVPIGSLEAYKNAEEWNGFKNIVEKEMP